MLFPLTVRTYYEVYGWLSIEEITTSYRTYWCYSGTSSTTCKIYGNALKPTEISKIWFPFFNFENTKKKSLSLIDNKASLKVLRNGDGELSGSHETENKYIFDGYENYVEYRRFYSEELECQFHLHWYPFDTQLCYVEVSATEDLQDFIMFGVDSFQYLGPLDLTEFMVRRTDMKVVNGTLLRVEIVIQRRLLSLVLTAFVPTIILNIIGHMSNYFKEMFFEGLMSLNVTVTLVLTTMFLRYLQWNFTNFSWKIIILV